MTQNLLRRSWPALFALAWLLQPATAQAWGPNPPIPINTNGVFVWRLDVKIGPSAFARPAGPWYSYFPADPNLMVQPRASAFPNWPSQFPPAPAPAPVRPTPGMTYYQPTMPYGYGAAVNPVSYNVPQINFWEAR
jgi:hypothetical protein